MDTTLAACVQRGIARLDAKSPNWRQSVNLDTLDMQSAKLGILEQAFGSYNVGLMLLGLWFSSAVDFGFDIEADEEDESLNRARWQALTDTWKAALQPQKESTV